MRLLPFEYGVRNLGRSPGRLAAGVGGIALVVLLLLAAAAFVRGMGESLRGSGGEGNVLLIGAGSEESVERSEVPPTVPGIAAASIPGLKRRLGLPFVSPEVSMALECDFGAGAGGGERFASFRGVTTAAFLVHTRARIAEGRFPGPGEVLAGTLAPVRLGVPRERLAIGSTFLVDGRKWTVSGRLEAPGTVMDAEIWAPLQDLKATMRRDNLSTVVVTMEPGEAAEAETFAKQRLDLELTAVAEEVYYDRLVAFYGPIRGLVWTTALFVAAGAFLGGLNTLYASFASRIREMATLQVLGFSRRAVVIGLVQEALLVAAAGSLLAAAAASWGLDGLSVRISMGAFGLRVDGPVLAFGLASGIGLGALGALLPAWRCLRPPVAEGLRSV